jgi:hypothetical protein
MTFRSARGDTLSIIHTQLPKNLIQIRRHKYFCIEICKAQTDTEWNNDKMPKKKFQFWHWPTWDPFLSCSPKNRASYYPYKMFQCLSFQDFACQAVCFTLLLLKLFHRTKFLLYYTTEYRLSFKQQKSLWLGLENKGIYSIWNSISHAYSF